MQSPRWAQDTQNCHLGLWTCSCVMMEELHAFRPEAGRL